MKKEVYPKNILMVGPTGCGKTEVLICLIQNHLLFVELDR